jgi:hypothetical protein
MPTEQDKDEHIRREFGVRQSRQMYAIMLTVLALLVSALAYKRPAILELVSTRTLFVIQVVAIATFFGFSILNWRCPACGKGLGNNIVRVRCRKCGTQLQ